MRAMLRPNRRPALNVGGTRVLLSELACCRVGWDGASRATQPNNAALRLSSEPAARGCCQLMCLHGVWNWRGSLCVEVAPRLHRPCLGRRRRLLVRTSRLSEARRRLVVRGKALSCEAETLSEKPSPSWRLVGEASNMLETRRLSGDGLDEDMKLSLCVGP
jgi:hypothetical protein